MAGYATPSWANNASPAVNAANLLAMGQGIELAQHPYGVSATAAATAAKTVTIDFSGSLALFTGLTVRVKFTYANTASAPTLNVNGTGAKAIKSYGTTAAPSWVAGQILNFTYDGTNWLYSGVDAFTKQQTLSASTASTLTSKLGTSISTPDAALLALGNAISSGAQIAQGTYTGTGTYGSGNKNSLTLGFTPKLIIVKDAQTSSTASGWIRALMVGGCTAGVALGGNQYTYALVVSWGTTTTWYSASNAAYQLNTSGLTYYYVAIG